MNKITYPMDCHTHSNTSPDAKNSVEEMCLSAINKGLSHICITSHYEVGSDDYVLDLKSYDREIQCAREKYADRIEILKGIEFGSPHRHQKEFQKIQRENFDMIISSVHSIPMDFPVWLLWEPEYDAVIAKNRQRILHTYFDEMRKMTAFGGFQVIAHMDWLRHSYSVTEMMNEGIEEIMSNAVKNDLVPEINAVGIRYFDGIPHPAPDFLRCYVQQGGERVTIGSDSHQMDSIASCFDKIPELFKDIPLTAGFFRNKEFIPACSIGGLK